MLLLLLLLRSESEELLRFHFCARALVASMLTGRQRDIEKVVGGHRWVDQRRTREGEELVVDCSREEASSSLAGLLLGGRVVGEEVVLSWTTIETKS